jgi:preprotein translocase subunit SecA
MARSATRGRTAGGSAAAGAGTASAAGAGTATATRPAAAAGTAGAAGASPLAGLSSGPAVRGVRESVGDQVTESSRGAGGTRPGFTPSGERIGRNDPCFCGSGLKYKKCHGR